MGSLGDSRKSFLLAGMKGTVYTWLQDQEGWRSWGYDGLKAALKKEYGTELNQNLTRLENLEFRTDMYKFNRDFGKIGSTCKKICPEGMQKQIYLRAIRPQALATHLTSFSIDHTLQQVMAAAVMMEPRFKNQAPRPTTTPQYRTNTPNTPNRPFIHDPDRIKCPKCNRWHNKNVKCLTGPVGGSGANRGNDGDRSGNRWKTTRVNEVEAEPIHEEEIAQDGGDNSDPGSDCEGSHHSSKACF